MDRPGPPLAMLTHRLAATPEAFLAEPATGNGDTQGTLAVAALVNDVLHLHGRRAGATAVQQFEGGAGKLEHNRLQLAAVCAWVLADAWCIAAGLPKDVLLRALVEASAQLAVAGGARRFTGDAERREELARTVLACLGLLPDGETAVQAADRLSAISGTERRALLAASRAAEQRAREIRTALAAKAAQESADKWTRE